MYLLDTNTLIYFFKGQGRVAQNVLSVAPGETFLPYIAVYEIQTGIAKSKHPEKLRQDLENFLAMVSVLPFGLAESRSAARIRAHLETAGTPIGPYDVLIAATALANGLTLVSRNLREFNRIEGLRVVDWF